MKKILILCLMLLPFGAWAQTITGKISSEGQAVDAFVYFKEASRPNLIKEYRYAKDGRFEITLEKSYDTLLLEVKSNQHFPKIMILGHLPKDQKKHLDIQLKAKDPLKMKEVEIIAENKGYEYKKDTIAYDVEAYKDDEDRKVEDVIKKLPGVEVDEKSGRITVGGKDIETVNLDGDDLFSRNYTLGTKNINIDIVDQIEIIDNYSSNPLLKGVEKGGKIALNLKLKKNRMDFSGSFSLGLGAFDMDQLASDNQATLLGVTSNFKSFGIIAHNNVGYNRSPFDYFSFSQNMEDTDELDIVAQKVIPETSFSNILSDSRANINSQVFANYNFIVRLTPRVKLRSNLYFLQDHIKAFQNFESSYLIESNRIEISQQTDSHKKPLQLRGDVKLDVNTTKTSLLTYDFKLKDEKIKTNATLLKNEVQNFASRLRTDNRFMTQGLTFTQKIGRSKALQLIFRHASNDVPQELKLQSTDQLTQKSHGQKQLYKGEAILLGALGYHKYSTKVGTSFSQAPFASQFYNGTLLSTAQNDLEHKKHDLFVESSISFSFGKVEITPTLRLSSLHQMVDYKRTARSLDTTSLLFSPSLDIDINVSRDFKIYANASIEQIQEIDDNLFTEEIMVDNRTVITNTPSFALQKMEYYSLMSGYNNLDAQIDLFAGISYTKDAGGFFNDMSIDEENTKLNAFFLDIPFERVATTGKIGKVFLSLGMSFKYGISQSYMQGQSYTNGNIYDYEGRNNTQNFFMKSSWKTILNFHNNIVLSQSRNHNQDLDRIFANKSLRNTFTLVIKPFKGLQLNLINTFYQQNLEEKNYYSFYDALLVYKPKKKKEKKHYWDFRLEYKNLTNIKYFQRFNNSSIGSSTYRSNIIPRYFIIYTSFNF